MTDATLIRDVRDYLDYVRGEAARLEAAGSTDDEAVAEIEPPRSSAGPVGQPRVDRLRGAHFYAEDR